jgi:hypothetical protein
MLKDKEVRECLENHYRIACQIVSVNPRDRVKLMGRKKRYESIQSAYYIQLQNFTSLAEAKRFPDEDYVRYYVRCLQFKTQQFPIFEIEKWYPSRGTVEQGKVIYRSDRDSGDFLRHLSVLIYWCHHRL